MNGEVALREVTRGTLRAICALEVADEQRDLVAPNAISIAQAYFHDEAWFRAIYAGDEAVGFVMIYDPTLAAAPEEPDFFLWRLMVDRHHQGRGYGRDAVRLVIDHVRTRGANRLLVTHVRRADQLGRFYGSLGFRYTGKEEEGELVMELVLA
jgi:diamine N-acetyltransferase